MMLKQLVKLLSTFFYVGYFPKAPGSAASIVGLIFYCLLQDQMMFYCILFGLITIAGFAVTGEMEKIVQEKDPSCIVIDEVSGMMIAFFLLPLKWPIIVTGFFLFRAFDMFKIYPVNKFESLRGGIGIMMDDIMAGIYTNITMHIAIRWIG